jgi:hypothetical protein
VRRARIGDHQGVATLATPTSRLGAGPGTEGEVMYIGAGTVVVILAVIIVFMLMRGRRV